MAAVDVRTVVRVIHILWGQFGGHPVVLLSTAPGAVLRIHETWSATASSLLLISSALVKEHGDDHSSALGFQGCSKADGQGPRKGVLPAGLIVLAAIVAPV